MPDAVTTAALAAGAVVFAIVSTVALVLGVNLIQIRAVESGNVNAFAAARWVGGAISAALTVPALLLADLIASLGPWASVAFATAAAGPPVYFTSRATGRVGTWRDVRECFLFYEEREEHWSEGWEDWLSGERPDEYAE